MFSSILGCVFMNNEEHVYIKIYISHFILERGTQFVVSLRDRWKNIYSKRGLLLAPYLHPGARGCQRLQAESSETSKTLLIGCLSLAQLSVLWTLSKSDHVVLISRGLLPVTHKSQIHFPLSYNCLLVLTV